MEEKVGEGKGRGKKRRWGRGGAQNYKEFEAGPICNLHLFEAKTLSDGAQLCWQLYKPQIKMFLCLKRNKVLAEGVAQRCRPCGACTATGAVPSTANNE